MNSIDWPYILFIGMFVIGLVINGTVSLAINRAILTGTNVVIHFSRMSMW